MRFLRDSVWTFIAAILALLALIFSVYTYFGNRETKSLRIEILSNSPLISMDDNITKDITVLYKDRPVRAVSLILVRLENSGNVPIRENDYSSPIVFSLASNAEVGEASIVETKPNSIEISPAKIATNQTELSNSLLNPGDQVLLRILALNNDGTLNITARIAGISEVEIVPVLGGGGTQSQSSNTALQNALAMMIAVIFFVFLASAFIWDSPVGIRWRQRLLGLDPASYFYTLAQANARSQTSLALRYLKITFSWDRSYLKRALDDRRFDDLKGYEPFDALIRQFSETDKDSNQTTEN